MKGAETKEGGFKHHLSNNMNSTWWCSTILRFLLTFVTHFHFHSLKFYIWIWICIFEYTNAMNIVCNEQWAMSSIFLRKCIIFRCSIECFFKFALFLPYRRSFSWMHLEEFWNFVCTHVRDWCETWHVSWAPSQETAYPCIGNRRHLKWEKPQNFI